MEKRKDFKTSICTCPVPFWGLEHFPPPQRTFENTSAGPLERCYSDRKPSQFKHHLIQCLNSMAQSFQFLQPKETENCQRKTITLNRRGTLQGCACCVTSHAHLFSEPEKEQTRFSLQKCDCHLLHVVQCGRPAISHASRDLGPAVSQSVACRDMGTTINVLRAQGISILDATERSRLFFFLCLPERDSIKRRFRDCTVLRDIKGR